MFWWAAKKNWVKEERWCVRLLCVAIYFNFCHFILHLIDVRECINTRHGWKKKRKRATSFSVKWWNRIYLLGYGCVFLFLCVRCVSFSYAVNLVCWLLFCAISFYRSMHMLMCDMWYNLLLLPVLLHFSSWLNFQIFYVCVHECEPTMKRPQRRVSYGCVHMIWTRLKRERTNGNQVFNFSDRFRRSLVV